MTTSRLKPADAVLVVVDMQERLLAAIHESGQVIANTRLLLRAAETLALPVVATTQYLKGLGPIQPDIVALAAGISPIDKMTFSCFGNEKVLEALASTGRKTLLLCGVEAHICVLQTGLDALGAGYEVHLITDATGSRNAANAVLRHRRLGRSGAVLSSTEMAIYELLGAAGTPAFKALLPHFK